MKIIIKQLTNSNVILILMTPILGTASIFLEITLAFTKLTI